MQGVSRESFAAGRDALSRAFDHGGVDGGSLGGDLFGVAGVLDNNGGLRRAFTDPNADASTKIALVKRLLEGKVSQQAIDVVADLVTRRWTSGRDLTDALEQLGVEAVVIGADREGQLNQVEDEVFRFGRIAAGDQRLQAALTDSHRSADDRGALVDRLLTDKVDRHSAQLIRQLVTQPRGRRLESSFDDVSKLIANRRRQTVALVTTTVPLSHEQRNRLKSALSRIYGMDVYLNVDLDPSLLGGIRIQVGEDMIDGSVLARLHEAERRIAG